MFNFAPAKTEIAPQCKLRHYFKSYNRAILCAFQHFGTMAEWLGNGLQNRLQRFDSAWYLSFLIGLRLPAEGR